MIDAHNSSPIFRYVHHNSIGSDGQTVKAIEKYQINARSIVVYLRALAAGASLKLPYRLVPKMPLKVTAPRGLVYEYYDPDRKATAPAVQITVVDRG